MMKSTFMFLTNLAYKNRLTIPLFVTVSVFPCHKKTIIKKFNPQIAFLVCNFRWEIEISIQTERIELQANNDDIEELSDMADSDDEYEPVTDDDVTDGSIDELI